MKSKRVLTANLVIILIALNCITSIYAQNNKSVFVELGGNGLLFSANFDSRFTKSEKGFGFRAGIGFIPPNDAGDADILFPSTPFVLTIPVAINHLAGKAPNYFESGLGATYVHISGNVSSNFWGYDEDVTGSAVLFIPSIGYRHAKTGQGFQWRICVTPIIGGAGASFWAGFSAGYKF